METRTYTVTVNVDPTVERRERGEFWAENLPDWLAETLEHSTRARISGMTVADVHAA